MSKRLLSVPASICLVGVTAAALFLADAAHVTPVAAQGTGRRLSYEQVFPTGAGGTPSGPDVIGRLPRITGWLDGDHYLETRREANGATRVYSVSAVNGRSEVYRDYPSLARQLPEGFDLAGAVATTPDLTAFVFDHDNDLYHYDVATERFRRLTSTPAPERNATLSPDGSWVAYTRDHDLFGYDLGESIEHRYTSDGSETVYNGWASWVYFEEILGRRSAYKAFWWSPDSARLVFIRFDDSPVPRFPIYHADGQHGDLELQRYPKAGDPNPHVSMGIVHVSTRETTWLNFEERADHYLAWPFWTPDGSSVTVQWMNRAQDTLRLFTADPVSGVTTLVLEERQASWVRFFTDLYHFSNGSGFLVRSDADGWSHLYYYSPQGELRARLTSGEWQVTSIAQVDEAGGFVYFTARREPTWDTHAMRVRLDGTDLEQLTGEGGTHQIRVSPSGEYFIDTHSSLTSPPRMVLARGDGRIVRELGDTTLPATDTYAWGRAELFTIPSDDGAFQLPAYWVLPPDFDPTQRYPVIVSIYGGPDAGLVRNGWLGLTPHYWAQRGVITFSIDHRASGHFGKRGVALMHRRLGQWEMADLIAGAKLLRTKPFVDPDKIGIGGGSYGGYTTLMALTSGSEHFNFGVARSPVSDWALYDTVYTERYMDTPAENPEGYRDGAVLAWIDRYRGGLLLMHGTVDDNVHLQNSVQIVDWLTSHDRPFELMLYPDSRHGFQASQRAHAARVTHDFWDRHLLGRPDLTPSTATDRQP